MRVLCNLAAAKKILFRLKKREHSRKPDEQYDLIEACSLGPYLEIFARGPRKGWFGWGNQADKYSPDWDTYSNHSQSNVVLLK